MCWMCSETKGKDPKMSVYVKVSLCPYLFFESVGKLVEISVSMLIISKASVSFLRKCF